MAQLTALRSLPKIAAKQPTPVVQPCFDSGSAELITGRCNAFGSAVARNALSLRKATRALEGKVGAGLDAQGQGTNHWSADVEAGVFAPLARNHRGLQ